MKAFAIFTRVALVLCTFLCLYNPALVKGVETRSQAQNYKQLAADIENRMKAKLGYNGQNLPLPRKNEIILDVLKAELKKLFEKEQESQRMPNNLLTEESKKKILQDFQKASMSPQTRNTMRQYMLYKQEIQRQNAQQLQKESEEKHVCLLCQDDTFSFTQEQDQKQNQNAHQHQCRSQPQDQNQKEETKQRDLVHFNCNCAQSKDHFIHKDCFQEKNFQQLRLYQEGTRNQFNQERTAYEQYTTKNGHILLGQFRCPQCDQKVSLLTLFDSYAGSQQTQSITQKQTNTVRNIIFDYQAISTGTPEEMEARSEAVEKQYNHFFDENTGNLKEEIVREQREQDQYQRQRERWNQNRRDKVQVKPITLPQSLLQQNENLVSVQTSTNNQSGVENQSSSVEEVARAKRDFEERYMRELSKNFEQIRQNLKHSGKGYFTQMDVGKDEDYKKLLAIFSSEQIFSAEGEATANKTQKTERKPNLTAKRLIEEFKDTVNAVEESEYLEQERIEAEKRDEEQRIEAEIRQEEQRREEERKREEERREREEREEIERREEQYRWRQFYFKLKIILLNLAFVGTVTGLVFSCYQCCCKKTGCCCRRKMSEEEIEEERQEEEKENDSVIDQTDQTLQDCDQSQTDLENPSPTATTVRNESDQNELEQQVGNEQELQGSVSPAQDQDAQEQEVQEQIETDLEQQVNEQNEEEEEDVKMVPCCYSCCRRRKKRVVWTAYDQEQGASYDNIDNQFQYQHPFQQQYQFQTQNQNLNLYQQQQPYQQTQSY